MDNTLSSGLSAGEPEVEYVSMGLRCGHGPGDLQLRLHCVSLAGEDNTDWRNAPAPEDSVTVSLQNNQP